MHSVSSVVAHPTLEFLTLCNFKLKNRNHTYSNGHTFRESVVLCKSAAMPNPLEDSKPFKEGNF